MLAGDHDYLQHIIKILHRKLDTGILTWAIAVETLNTHPTV